jgi:FkbM family methyltransferase
MTVNGVTGPSKLQRLLDSLRFKALYSPFKYINVDDGEYRYSFRCETRLEVWRAMTLLTKEEGTVQWIRSQVNVGNVFYDIGANIGLYTLLAGKRVGEEGMVYAFEPHVANVCSLLHNVSCNGLNRSVKVMSCALNDKEGFFDFNYNSWVSGSSMSQLNDNRDDSGREFQPVCSEFKFATTIDKLIINGVIKPPTHIKIDVDGNELLVLKGMQELMSSKTRPAFIQVEINPRNKDTVYQFMLEREFALHEKHYTLNGKQAIANGRSPEDVTAYNAIFSPK